MTISNRDNGCDLHPDCFTCPFPDCRLQTTGVIIGIKNKQRNDEIKRLYFKGLMRQQAIADKFNINVRTVQRVLSLK